MTSAVTESLFQTRLAYLKPQYFHRFSLTPRELPSVSLVMVMMCCVFVTVGDGAQFEGKEDSDEPFCYGRRKSLVSTMNFCGIIIVMNHRV